MRKRKSRNLPIHEYLIVLQLEYYVTDLRRKIYPYNRHKRFYAELANSKKDKINDIADRNGIDCIFTSKHIKNEIYSKVIDFGIPNFIYASSKEKARIERWDLVNYFFKDVLFVDKTGNFLTIDAEKVRNANFNDINNDFRVNAKYSDSGEIKEVRLGDIKRVL